MPPVPQPKVLMVFDGVLITYFKIATNAYQVGVVPAAEHQFTIIITEFQKEMTSEGEVDFPVRTQEINISDFPPDKRNWTFQVDQTSPTPAPARPFDSGQIPNRLGTPTGDPAMDYRWPLGLHDTRDFPEHGALTKQPRVFNPIINFMNGLFYTRGLTASVPQIFRKANGEGRQRLGIISSQFAAQIDDIVNDGHMLLKDGGGEEIFNLTFKENRRFSILFQNAPSHLDQTAVGVPSHFPLYYTAFTPVNKRYDLVFQSPGFPGPSIPNLGPLTAGHFGGPTPFRCGPVRAEVPLED